MWIVNILVAVVIYWFGFGTCAIISINKSDD